ncbi:glycoside hydrolase family 18 protein [Streptomyces sp. NPDC058758]|uniref:glycoside hydrolase family 18 protein n=1 Tax=Streptomyces sp. NPDC058758 TaxID=3346627 RepID=UPI00369D7D6D
MDGRLRRMWRKGRWWVLVPVLLLVVPPLFGALALRVSYAGDLRDDARTRGKDAYWIGHAWVDGRKKDADLAALAERLEGTGVRDLYVHAGPLEHDGTLPAARHPRAKWLTDGVHRVLPGIRVQAWLGDVLANEGPTGLRLSDAASRKAVTASARQVLDAGFDGVHFDLEPLQSGDPHYLTLLDDLGRLTRSRNAPLSVAAHQIDPLPGAHSVLRLFSDQGKWWSQEYFGEVARRVDQIAVMSYDTWMPLESSYGGYVAQQTALALEATPDSTDLLMGLPFFHEDDLGHHESAETVGAAVRGVRLGLGRTDPGRERFGVALYVDFAEEPGDWAAYRAGWSPTGRAPEEGG